MSKRHCFLAATLLGTLSAPALADDGGLSDSQTSYTGAVMLEGELDVDFGDVVVGDMGLDEGQSQYAYFTGNTLYFGSEDDYGNAVHGISEFFWFESSIDRGSDFYVAIIKVRTTPNVSEGWYLDVKGEPVNYVRAEMDTEREQGAFRWDWSVPFENYGMDSYGEVSMTTEYGIGGSAEGSAMYAQKYEEDGTTADVDVQAKGYLNTEYKVSTQYQVTLYRWNTVVNGGAGYMDWTVELEPDDREEQSAYHEYFLVMQVDEGETFTIDRFDIGGGFNGWWWGEDTTLGVALTDITLSPPAYEPDEEEEEEEEEGGDDGGDEGDDDWGDTGWDDEDELEDDEDDDAVETIRLPMDDDDDDSDGVIVNLFGCSTAAAAPATGLFAWSLIALAALRRRD